MAGTFPIALKAGFTHSLQIRCAYTKFRSGKEQRYAVSGLLNSFRLPYTNIKWADLTAIRDFFITQKGAFDSTWKLNTVDPSTQSARDYEDLAFNSDEFSYTEGSIGRYSVTLDVVQTVAESVTVSTSTNFPTISGGVKVQLPFRTSVAYRTERNDMDSGKRISYAVWPNPLRSWPLEYGAITDDEVADLVDFYLGQGGPVNAFTFTDPNTSVAHSNCRFADQPLVITRVSTGVNKVSLGIEEFKG
jgi:hypothetical protein